MAADGRQRISVSGYQAGRWVVQLQWSADGRDFYTEREWSSEIMLFLAGMLLGLAGSAHCVFMCGPLVLTARCSTPAGALVLPYHAGRTPDLRTAGAGAAAGGACGRRGWNGARAVGRVRSGRVDGGGREVAAGDCSPG